MRRSKKLSSSVTIFLLLAAFFNLFSYSLDQLIVQGEDKLRKLNNDLQNKRLIVSDLSNSLNIFQNLRYEISYEADLLSSIIGFNSKSYNIFQSQSDSSNEIDAKLTDKNLIKNSKELELFYAKSIEDWIKIINKKTKQFHKIFKENFSSGQTFEYLKSDQSFNIYLDKPIFVISKKEYNEFSDGFEAYEFLTEYNDKLYNIEDELDSFETKIEREYLFSISKYFDVLDVYSNQNNFNNYLILSSILSQILGLFFLLFLFRSLIKENY